MQLAGNLFPEDINRRDRSLGRKLREMRVALDIEKRYTKDKILELYLNQIDLGNRAYGVEVASQRYFGKQCPRAQHRRGRDAGRDPQGADDLQPAPQPRAQRAAPQPRHRPHARRGPHQRPRRPSAGAPSRCCSRRAPISAASRNTSSSTCGSRCRPASARTSIARASASTPRSISTCSSPPSARSRPSSSAIETGGPRYGKFPHRTYAQYLERPR